jgi:hypothetical protein
MERLRTSAGSASPLTLSASKYKARGRSAPKTGGPSGCPIKYHFFLNVLGPQGTPGDRTDIVKFASVSLPPEATLKTGMRGGSDHIGSSDRSSLTPGPSIRTDLQFNTSVSGVQIEVVIADNHSAPPQLLIRPVRLRATCQHCGGKFEIF